MIVRVEVDGRAATAEQLSRLAMSNFGHHTAMQVRGGRVRGLRLHLDRLDAATRELFGVGLDGDRVRDHIRHAVGAEDASVRVIVFQPPSIMVGVRTPTDPTAAPQRLRSVRYQRPVAHIKHLGGFAQTYYRRLVARDGYDEALLVGPDGLVCEGAITNIAFFDGTEVVWPDAPALHGVTMQLLQGLPSRSSPVHLADLHGYQAAFVTNSIGIAPVGQIDDLTFAVDHELMKTVTEIYESVPWDPI
jgi:branched-subunit amino acid aminotransferase/4-amino-4-deoxychorismate lyase